MPQCVREGTADRGEVFARHCRGELEARRLDSVEADVPLAALEHLVYGDGEVERAGLIGLAGGDGVLAKRLQLFQSAQIGAQDRGAAPRRVFNSTTLLKIPCPRGWTPISTGRARMPATRRVAQRRALGLSGGSAGVRGSLRVPDQAAAGRRPRRVGRGNSASTSRSTTRCHRRTCSYDAYSHVHRSTWIAVGQPASDAILAFYGKDLPVTDSK